MQRIFTSPAKKQAGPVKIADFRVRLGNKMNKKIGGPIQLLAVISAFLLGIFLGIVLMTRDIKWIDIQSVFSTFIGALFAFLLGLLAFYLNEKHKEDKHEARLSKCVSHELEYNRRLIRTLLHNINLFENGIKEDKNVTTTFNYSYYLRFFISEYFKSGYMWDKLDKDNIHTIEQVLTFMNPDTGTLLYASLQKWNKREKNFNKDEVLKVLSTAKGTLLSVDSYIANIINKIEKPLIRC